MLGNRLPTEEIFHAMVTKIEAEEKLRVLVADVMTTTSTEETRLRPTAGYMATTTSSPGSQGSWMVTSQEASLEEAYAALDHQQ